MLCWQLNLALMCLGRVCTKSFSNPFGHVMPADLYQTAELSFCLDSSLLEGFALVFLVCLLRRKSEEGKKTDDK